MTSSEVTAGPVRIMFAGGGTGGHLYPAIAVAEEIRRRCPSAEITFVGNRKNIEARVVPEHGFAFLPIWVAGFRRSVSVDNLLAMIKLVIALVQSFLAIRKVRPRVVVGTGGYVCGPPLFVASLLGVPTLIQEQNSFPGVTTRMLAPRVNQVHLSFERTRAVITRTEGVFVTGNPTRAAIGGVDRLRGAERMQANSRKFTLLVMGGSRGARSINDAMVEVVPLLTEMDIQVLWSSGKDDFDRCRAALESLKENQRSLVRLLPYIEEMEFALAAADLVVCRAGATTIAEVARAGLPSVLIPYPFAAADHQSDNAAAMEQAGAAVVLRDVDARKLLLSVLQQLIGDPERMRRMADRAKTMGASGATETLAGAVLRLAGV
jgi:UDP-N-acetylglucosamine--N-acetylmuramyl-(pentapeptide) pyrophosphoryl-undecaprenol N-acetylglucosamine transferase